MQYLLNKRHMPFRFRPKDALSISITLTKRTPETSNIQAKRCIGYLIKLFEKMDQGSGVVLLAAENCTLIASIKPICWNKQILSHPESNTCTHSKILNTNKYQCSSIHFSESQVSLLEIIHITNLYINESEGCPTPCHSFLLSLEVHKPYAFLLTASSVSTNFWKDIMEILSTPQQQQSETWKSYGPVYWLVKTWKYWT